MSITKGLGWRPALPDQRDYRFSFVNAPRAATVDLRETGFLPDVWDQGYLGSCVPHGVDCAYAYDLARQGEGSNWAGSKLFLYYNGRVRENTVNEDSGLTITDGIKVLNESGTAPDVDWPYEIDRFTERPPEIAYLDGKLHEAVKYVKVNQTVADMQACLTAGTPIVIGFTVYESFMSDIVAETGGVPMPDISEDSLGGHCVVIVGYTFRNGHAVWICRNSWGTEWGDGGYFYMPQAYLTSRSLASDFWTVQSVSSPLPGPVPTPTPVPDPAPTPAPTPSPIEESVVDKVVAKLEELIEWIKKEFS